MLVNAIGILNRLYDARIAVSNKQDQRISHARFAANSSVHYVTPFFALGRGQQHRGRNWPLLSRAPLAPEKNKLAVLIDILPLRSRNLALLFSEVALTAEEVSVALKEV